MKTFLTYFLFVALVLLTSKVWAIDVYLKQVNLPGDIKVSSINVLLPDSSGFIWMGTTNGLCRWDGIRIEEYPVIGNNNAVNITSLTIGPDKNIWAGCNNGSIYFTSGENLKNWKPADTGLYTKITSLMFDRGGKLWWGTNGAGLFVFDGDNTSVIRADEGLPDNYIYNIEQGYYGEIWASTDRGVAVCKSWENLLEVDQLDTKSGLIDDIVRVVKKDKIDQMWLGFHEGGISFYENKSKSISLIKSLHTKNLGQVNEIAVDESGIWVALENGLYFLDQQDSTKNFEEVAFHGETKPLRLKTIVIDIFGNLWLLDKENLFVSSAGAFTRIKNKFDFDLSGIKAIAKATNQEIWLAKNSSIVMLSESSHSEYLSGMLKNTTGITAMKADEKGNLWISTFGKGVIVFNPKTKLHRFITEKDGLVNNNVLDISIHENEIWLATLGGASRLSVEKIWQNHNLNIDSYDKERGLGNNFIYNILQDTKGNVWFGTDGNGLVKFAEGEFMFFDESAGLNDDVVYSIAEDDDGNIWVSTATSGLYRFDGKEFKNYSFPAHLISNTIFSLACSGDLVFALTDLGLNILNRSTNVVTSINEELDLRKINADLNKVYSGEDFVCFVTQEGIIRINTKRFSAFAGLPQLVLDRVLVNLETTVLSESTKFGPDENKMVFEYTAFWYMAPSKVHYSVRLDGYDPDWKTTYDRRASFANLSSGSYTFEAKAFLEHPSTYDSKIARHFIILKPFYTRWWFILLVVVTGIIVLFLLIKSREKRLKMEESRKKEKLEFEFQTLKNQINPHFLFNSFSTLISTIEENPDIAVEYTEKLSDFFRNILEVKEQELIPINEEIDLINNYYYIQQKRFGENFILHINLNKIVRESFIPPLTLQLLAENAIKHNIVSKNKPLKVEISNSADFIFVQNNLQPKNQIEKSIGLGLRNIQERYRLLSGKEVLVEESTEYFKVILPIIKSWS